MAVPYTFATQTTSIPLAQLDTNFSTPVTIGTTTIPLGNIAPILENVTLGNVVIASGNVTLTNVNVINATITQATITTANVTTANITSAFITTANVTTANITTANVVTIRATTANIATANVTAMEAVAANVTTLRSTNINVTTANATTAYITTANVATANVTAMEAVSANVTTIRSTTANLTTANVTTAFITTANIATANVVTIIATTANIVTANVSAMEAVSANVTTLRSTTINVTTANVTTAFITTANIATANVTTLTTTGNTILGDATTDTLTVGVTGIVKDASGNVGIGTASPQSLLDLTGNDPTLRFTDNSGSPTATWSLRSNDANFSVRSVTAGSDRLVIDSSGNVGIGTSNPVQKFVVSNGGAAGLEIDPTSIASSPSLVSYNRSGASYTQLSYDASLHAWYTSGTEKMRLDSSGNVGIGRTPVLKLDLGNSFTSQSSTGINSSAKQFRIGASEAGVLLTTDVNTAGVGSGTQTSSATLGYGYISATFPTEFLIGTGTQTVASNLRFYNNNTERMRIDSVGNTYVQTGNLWQYSPAPTALAAGANAGTAAQLLGGMFSAAQTTAVTLTMPTGTAIDTGFAGVPAVDIGFYFYVINTGSALGAVTVAVNTNVTSLGSLVVAIGTSAQFRLRRTAANTYIMYRLS